MKHDDMVRRLDAGEKAIDLTVEKWGDIFNDIGTDEGGDNCACCYSDMSSTETRDCETCHIRKYELEHKDNAFPYGLCGNLPYEEDKEDVKKVIKYLNKVKDWMIEKGEY